MPFFRLVFRVLLVLLILLGLIGLMLPSSAQVTRSIVIDSPIEDVFPHVNSMRRFHDWSPWTRADPSTTYLFEGPETGVGARMRWYSGEEGVGEGSQLITLSEPHRRVETALVFGDQGEGTATFLLTPIDGATELEWRFQTAFGWDIFSRYVGLMLDGMIGSAYKRGLQTLKQRLETPEVADTTSDVPPRE
jgi:hypothetical protein